MKKGKGKKKMYMYGGKAKKKNTVVPKMKYGGKNKMKGSINC